MAQHCENLSRVRDDQALRLTEAERQANARMQQLLEARRQRKAVDKLMERQRATHQRALAREEQRFLDELSQRRSLCWPTATPQPSPVC
jgi:flagellar export protein FliJ